MALGTQLNSTYARWCKDAGVMNGVVVPDWAVYVCAETELMPYLRQVLLRVARDDVQLQEAIEAASLLADHAVVALAKEALRGKVMDRALARRRAGVMWRGGW